MTIQVLHVAPHPDDEVLGAGGTLLRLAEDGCRVHNLAVSLGSPDQAERRRRELERSIDRLGSISHLATPPIPISRHDDLVAAEGAVERAVLDLITGEGIDLLVAPSPHDGHHGHEVVGRAVWRAAQRTGTPLWLWGLWAELPLPSLLVPLTETHIERAEHALAAHAGELARNDYARLLRARATVNAVLGPERVFGFGSTGIDAPFAELLMEVGFDRDGAWLGRPRSYGDGGPLEAAGRGASLDVWYASRSPRATILDGNGVTPE